MEDIRIDTDDAENTEEGYPLAPSPPAKEIIPQVPPKIYPPVSLYDPPPKIPFQYTLADIFTLTTAVAVLMSILKFFPLHYYRGGKRIGSIVQFDPAAHLAAGATATSTRLVGAVRTLSAGLHRGNYF